MSDTKPRQFDLKQAREIALEYAEPGSMIDNGNLFFALGEFMESHDALEARIAELEIALTESLRLMDMNFDKFYASYARDAARAVLAKKGTP